jgi:chaperonin GroEL (HSP60 family)
MAWSDDNQEIAMLKAQARAELNRLEADAPAKEVAGKAIGKHGLAYITAIVVVGVGASLMLEESKIAAVIGLVSAALTALISMLNGIAGANPKQERPEFEVMKQLIDKLDRLDRQEQPMRVDVEGGKVTVRKGDDVITTGAK